MICKSTIQELRHSIGISQWIMLNWEILTIRLSKGLKKPIWIWWPIWQKWASLKRYFRVRNILNNWIRWSKIFKAILLRVLRTFRARMSLRICNFSKNWALTTGRSSLAFKNRKMSTMIMCRLWLRVMSNRWSSRYCPAQEQHPRLFWKYWSTEIWIQRSQNQKDSGIFGVLWSSVDVGRCLLSKADSERPVKSRRFCYSDSIGQRKSLWLGKWYRKSRKYA